MEFSLDPARLGRAVIYALLAAVGMTACSSDYDRPATAPVGIPGVATPLLEPVSAAQFEGPIAGAPTLVGTFIDLPALGYTVETEFFVTGTANAYDNVNVLEPDGKWVLQAAESAGYRTRIVVIRPQQAADFNGTVFVEWLNVSAGFDSGPDWNMVHTELIRQGYAWVGVSAQKVGVDALVDGSAAAVVPGGMSGDRYDTLIHPGDEYSYSIYSQVAQALRAGSNLSVLGDLQVQRLLAAGESQSAGRLMTYINGFAPMHALFDSYFVHSRTMGSAGLRGSLLEPTLPTPDVVRVREDLGVPVMMLQTETDLFILGSYPSNQPDGDLFRLWEVAGTAHADLYTFLDNRFDVGDNPAVAAVVENAAPIPGIIECDIPVNSGPQHFVANAAVRALQNWMVNGVAPPKAERLRVAGEPPAFERDALGNVLGGVRTPYVDVPIAVLEGEGQPQPDLSVVDELSVDTVDFCFLSGTTRLLDAGTLASLYADNEDYIAQVNASADAAVAQGFLVAEDAALIKAQVATADIFAAP